MAARSWRAWLRRSLLPRNARTPAAGCQTGALALLALLAACSTTNLAPPIASFQKSVTTSSAAIGTAFNNLNEIQRQLYLDEVALDPEKEVATRDSSGAATPLLGRTFQAPSIKARMDSLTLLGSYAEKLTSLVGNTPAEQLSEIAKRTGNSFATLDKTFADLSSNAYDPTAVKYINPVSELIGALIKMYYEHRRDEAIREAVNTGAPAVTKLLDGIETDLVEFIKPRQTAALSTRLDKLIDYYNRHRARPGMDLPQRQKLLEEINQCAAAYEASVEFNPSALIASIRQAHDALIKYANAPPTPANLNQLVTTLQALDEHAQLVQKEVEQIRQATKG
jgi:hypothetical protein